jgi:hypothetical protein
MSSSKVILVGAISVVFGLYTISLYRVNGYVGNTSEVAVYIARASENARTGAQRALDLWARGNDYTNSGSNDFPFSETRDLLEVPPTIDRCSWSVMINTWPGYFGYNDGRTYSITIVSHGYYKAPGEPAAFAGHEVVRTVKANFVNTNESGYWSFNNPWYNITVTSVSSIVNYWRERQLDSLQTGKSNVIGY